MKRATLWVFIGLLTFSIGVACALLWLLGLNFAETQSSSELSNETSATREEPLDLLYCHLMVVPEEYDGKLIRVQATFAIGIHGPMLRDRTCPNVVSQVWVNMSTERWEELERATERAYGMKNVRGSLDVVFVGRFGRNRNSGGSDALSDTSPYRFDLMRVERTARPQ